MRAGSRRVVLRFLGAALAVWTTLAPPAWAQPVPPASVADLLKSAADRLDENQLDEAVRLFSVARDRARASGDDASVAEAERGLGLSALERADYPAARQALDAALAIYATRGDRRGLARVHRHLAQLDDNVGNPGSAVDHARRAMVEAEAIGDRDEHARALLQYSGVLEDTAEIGAVLDRAEREARAGENRELLAQILQFAGDRAYTRGEFAGAQRLLEEAASLLVADGRQRLLSRVYTSLGRVHRAHNDNQIALDYFERGLNIQRTYRDMQGVIQSLNATAVALDALNRAEDARARYEEALELARQSGSPRYVNFMLGNLGGWWLSRGEYRQALPLLEEAVAKEQQGYVRNIRAMQLAIAYYSLDRHDEALAVATEAVDGMTKFGVVERLFEALYWRARIQDARGRRAEALTDIRDALAAIETLRAKLVPIDYLKRGFSDRNRQLFSAAIDMLERAGLHDDALMAAEQARARAFLDLLAARNLPTEDVRSAAGSTTDTSGTTRPSAPNDAGSSVLRGGAARAATAASGGSLASPASAGSASLDTLRAQARRLGSTILSYWVADDVTHAWVVAESGEVRSLRIAIPAARLARLIRATWGGLEDSSVAKASPPAAPRTTAAPAGEAAWVDTAVAILPRRASRELYRLLVLPLDSWLPRAPNARLTIVPHGPLFRLSFAALLDGRDRYLLERYVLHYVPAASLLEFTARTARPLRPRSSRVLFVSNPANMPAASDAPLPALPGAAREVSAIARDLPPEQVTLLDGVDAREPAVRGAVADKDILHFATHGIVVDDDPLASWLALGTGGGGASGDGRLSADEIYGFALRADLVVLSACRSGLGVVSADGIVGLTRAFFYAGAPSLVATLWDVVDGPAADLLHAFYGRLERADKASALRQAQLRLLADLRAGRVKVATGGGSAPLPERPVFWASFVLMGEP